MSNITINHNVMMQNIYAGGHVMMNQPISGLYSGHMMPTMTQFMPTSIASADYMFMPQPTNRTDKNTSSQKRSDERWRNLLTVNSRMPRHERIVYRAQQCPTQQDSFYKQASNHKDNFGQWTTIGNADRVSKIDKASCYSYQTVSPTNTPTNKAYKTNTSPVGNTHNVYVQPDISHNNVIFATPLRQLCLPAIRTSSNVAVNVMSDEFDLGYYSFSDSASLADSIDEINCQPLSDEDEISGFSDIIDDVLDSLDAKKVTKSEKLDVETSPAFSPHQLPVQCVKGEHSEIDAYRCNSSPQYQQNCVLDAANRPDSVTTDAPSLRPMDFQESDNFSTKHHMKEHTNRRSHTCPICAKSFSQKSTLRTHIRTHTGEKPFSCTYCKRAFGDYSTYRKHLRTHTGEKPYTCDVCHKSFTQSGNMIRHKEVHVRAQKKVKNVL